MRKISYDNSYARKLKPDYNAANESHDTELLLEKTPWGGGGEISTFEC